MIAMGVLRAALLQPTRGIASVYAVCAQLHATYHAALAGFEHAPDALGGSGARV